MEGEGAMEYMYARWWMDGWMDVRMYVCMCEAGTNEGMRCRQKEREKRKKKKKIEDGKERLGGDKRRTVERVWI